MNAVDPERYPLLPWPRKIEPRPGESPPGATTAVSLDSTIAPEGYVVDASEEGIRIAAGGERGVLYAQQALRQITRPDGSVPAVRIEDSPLFGWRGLHLDVSRHFFPVAFIKKYIEVLATYRLNVFHWHLTDDQGWRLDIGRYPRLTEIGAWRRETRVGHERRGPRGYDGTPHGGFYTRADVREVVRHAREHGVEVVPEIEMPGHSVAALAAYPELACGAPPSEVATRWGIHEEVYCPTERTFAFLADVLVEVAEMFPGRYIHIGGDEAPKTRWRACPHAQGVMRRERLRDEDELQSWFIQRIEKIVDGLGRRLVGWDEILEGGLAPNATVMSWRGTQGGIAAARLGHDVVICPQEDLYFDHYQGDQAVEPLAIGGMTTLEDVYRYEPVPDELSEDEAARVLGPQANLWTEYMPTPARVEYMAYPRALALAEIAWSPRDVRDVSSFVRRVRRELMWLDGLGVAYRPLTL